MKNLLEVAEYLAHGNKVIGHMIGETTNCFDRYCHLCGPSASSLSQMIIAVMDKKTPPLETIKPYSYGWEVICQRLLVLLKEHLLVPASSRS